KQQYQFLPLRELTQFVTKQKIFCESNIISCFLYEKLAKLERDAACCVSTPATGSLSAIVRSYKSAVSNIVRKNINPHFQWQTRFYDRIIRNEKELYRIRKYIEQNPLKWELEKNNPGNIIT
ncbi:MAG: hypothetical protein GXX85_04970, partial [Ignavibacteria bacterium]|nr:hypothetical protein [Ignavibacteria bacterium]